VQLVRIRYATNSHVPTTISWNWGKISPFVERDAVSQREAATHSSPNLRFSATYRSPTAGARSHYCAHKSQCRTFRRETVRRLFLLARLGVHPYSAHFRRPRYTYENIVNPPTFLSVCSQLFYGGKETSTLPGSTNSYVMATVGLYLHLSTFLRKDVGKTILKGVRVYSQFSPRHLVSVISESAFCSKSRYFVNDYTRTIATGVARSRSTEAKAKEKMAERKVAKTHTL